MVSAYLQNKGFIVVPHADLAWEQARALVPVKQLPWLYQALNQDARLLAVPEGARVHYTVPEYVLLQAAQLGGLDAGCAPVAAWQRLQAGHVCAGAWARLDLCHMALGMDDAQLRSAQQVGASAAECTALWQTLAAHIQDAGWQLDVPEVGASYAYVQAPAFKDLPSVSLARALECDVAALVHEAPSARPEHKTVQRVMTELNMLVYTHAVNEARAQQHAPLLNTVWLSGAGALPEGHTLAPIQVEQMDILGQGLSAAQQMHTAAAVAQAWQQLDAQLALRCQAAEGLTLCLCGAQAYVRLDCDLTAAAEGSSLWARMRAACAQAAAQVCGRANTPTRAQRLLDGLAA